MNPELEQKYEHMGTINERRFKPIIRELYGDVLKTSYKYACIDFYGLDYVLELKSRSCKSTDFSSAIIGYNKVIKGFKTLEKNPNHKVYFGFAYVDGFFVWELNSNTYEANGGDSRKKLMGTNKRGYDDYKDHLLIDIKNLKKVSDVEAYVPDGIIPVKSIPDNVCFLKLLKKI